MVMANLVWFIAAFAAPRINVAIAITARRSYPTCNCGCCVARYRRGNGVQHELVCVPTFSDLESESVQDGFVTCERAVRRSGSFCITPLPHREGHSQVDVTKFCFSECFPSTPHIYGGECVAPEVHTNITDHRRDAIRQRLSKVRAKASQKLRKRLDSADEMFDSALSRIGSDRFRP
eukprot:TRINITY_DN23578_c1_g1_i1.p1 TRINITY_DN23578_c1_g1~~TRINITY_DN23578_c1_g1_i1.p1  ORF type:complete len:189 (-),score=10.60 TRINITY_DN23578_c1_g1_i1:173-703(-)